MFPRFDDVFLKLLFVLSAHSMLIAIVLSGFRIPLTREDDDMAWDTCKDWFFGVFLQAGADLQFVAFLFERENVFWLRRFGGTVKGTRDG